MLSLFDVVAPAVPPKLSTFPVFAEVDTLDVPVNVKFVAVAMLSTVTPAVLEIVIPPVLPKAIERVLLLFDENKPVLSVRLFRSNVPCVKVVSCAVPNVRLFVTS